ncbi:MAG: hypothetical protein KGD59_03975 [Candidatus Heimdallarchaeota archaeon]|nr:hypothetical protein [Candidatus Heimdallarchaeota archaeon]MBY8993683.1 hypothetical protein [Candidatus Heimdallarchaeota archaeon]
MSTSKIKCPNCGKKIESWLVYCEFCGHLLDQARAPKIKAPTSNLKSNVTVASTTVDPVTGEKTLVVKASEQSRGGKKWNTPPKRERPAYHPIEWFFWIGWGLYVFFRYIGKEIVRYFKWCCCWGPPEELKKEE